MDTTIAVALVSGICTGVFSVVATVLSNNKSQSVINAKIEENNKFVDYKIEELRKQVEKHNKVIERTYKLEQEVHLIEDKIEMYHKHE